MEPSEEARKAWPAYYTLYEANIVFVSSEWSDPEQTPSVVGIAKRQRELFVEKGHLSTSAEVCSLACVY